MTIQVVQVTRDLNCPNCDFPEMGQVAITNALVQPDDGPAPAYGPAPLALYCNKCHFVQTLLGT